MHFYISNSDDLLFASFKDYCKFIKNNPLSIKAYEYFNLDSLENHKRYSNVVHEYLKSGHKYHFENYLA